MDVQPLVLTIGHQIGSGGAAIGQMLAEQLAIPFFDREILKSVAARLRVPETELAGREQRLSPLWDSLARAAECLDPGKSFFADQYVPTDKELFEFESDYITCIAEKNSAIFLGRCGQYILRRHPRHFRLFVQADLPARIQRLGQMYGWAPAEAEKRIDSNDRERAAYIHQFTKQNWLAPQHYDLCVNTTTVGLQKTVEIVMACLQAMKPQPPLS
jgi:CMP/dCMP kinase